MQIYDLAIVGAGITGCTLAHFCKDKNIILLERASTPATGGSGAAGAFISPKLGKKSALLELTNSAFTVASQFYSENFPKYYDKSGIVRLPKDAKDEENFPLYHRLSGGKLLDENALRDFGIHNQKQGLFFKDGGVCDAQGLCKALISGIPFKQFELQDLIREQDLWVLSAKSGKIMAKNVVLATGYEGHESLEYMGIRRVWGSRGDFYCESDIGVCMHKTVSISRKKEGVIKIGATHVKAKSATEACHICNGEPLKTLIEKAEEFADISNIKLKETFCGMRSGSHDYFPLVGKVIDARYMLQTYPNIRRGYKKAPIKYIDNLFVFNGVGGRGFVFAPMLAKWLKELIFEHREIDARVNPDRLFLKWARKL